MRIPADLMLLGGTIITMNDDWTLIHDGGIAIRAGSIAGLGTRASVQAEFHSNTIIHTDDCLLLPGLINAHTHAPMTLFRGLADDLPLDTWLKEYIWPAEGRSVNPEMVYWGTLLAADEMIRCGTTLFTDMYFFEDEIGQAAADAGIRVLLGEALVEFPSPNAKTPAEGLAYVEASIERWAGHPLVRPILQPHSTYACSPELLSQSKTLANEAGVPMLIHCCETQQEIVDVKSQTGKRPIELLSDLGILDERTILAHGVHLTDEEIDLLAKTKTSVVHCPESNMKLASGVARVPDLLQAGINVALGTDGAASNNDLNPWGEMQTAAKLHKVMTGDPTVVTARQAVWMATRGGARAFGLEERLGSLSAGKSADIVVIDLNSPHLFPMYEPYSQLVYTVRAADVRDVIIDGQIVLRDRQIRTIDEETVFGRISDMAEELGRHWGRDTDWRVGVGQ